MDEERKNPLTEYSPAYWSDEKNRQMTISEGRISKEEYIVLNCASAAVVGIRMELR